MSSLTMVSVVVTVLFVSSATFDVHVAATDTTTPDILQANGYKYETHHVTTEDGYILTAFRIVGNCTTEGCNQCTVLCQHGLFQSSESMIEHTDRSLALMLVDKGCDVWLGNARGTKYSQGHKCLDTSDKQYWDFSWHEMGVYDIPVVIDYILEVTGCCKLRYVGYSMGTTMVFVTLSCRPEYNPKMDLCVCLAPVVYMEHSSFALRLVDPALSVALKAGKLVSNHDGETSKKTLLHYLQLMNIKGSFHPYDECSTILDLFNKSDEPEPYDISKITCDMVMYNGQADRFADPEDVNYLNDILQNDHDLRTVSDPNFNHGDFMDHPSLNKLLNNEATCMLCDPSYKMCSGVKNCNRTK